MPIQSSHLNIRPLILLIEANDQSRYLASVSKEINALKQLLTPICDDLKYDIQYSSYSTSSELIDLISENKQRLLIIHFAGHSNNDFLKLDEGKLYAKGLAKKLVSCSKLELVFLNGCDNKKQVDMFIKAGLNTVIGTKQLINDAAAGEFSKRFYKSLGKQGLTLHQSFQEAEIDVEINNPNNYRSFELDSIINQTDQQSAWFFESRKPNWKLKHASNLCNWLPPLPRGELPAKPFKNLYYYREEDAEIFFGRCCEILELLNLLKQAEPLILLQGATGVGKSSFLQAGFIPRLRTYGQTIRYFRYNELDTDKSILKQLFSSDKLNEIVKTLHSNNKHPNVWILDQAEELFFDQKNNDLDILLTTLHDVFYPKNLDDRPNVKFIISLRTEWYGRLQDLCSKEYLLNFQDQLINILDKNSIIEVIESISKIKHLKKRYKLEIINPKNKELATQIANDILVDEKSNIVPILQITLWKLWEKAKYNKINFKVWNIQTYLKIKRNGLFLSDYLDQQLNSIEKENSWGKKYKENGLLLDILYIHTTPEGSIKNLKKSDYKYIYRHIKYRDEVLISLKNNYLLIEYINSDITRLSHDSLVNLVIVNYWKSSKSGQKARRELNEARKIYKYSNNFTFDRKKLKLVQKGLNATYCINRIESELIRRSKMRKNISLMKDYFYISLSFLFILMISYVFLWGDVINNSTKIEEINNEYKEIKFLLNNKDKDIKLIKNITNIIYSLNKVLREETNFEFKYDILRVRILLADAHLTKSILKYKNNQKIYNKNSILKEASESISISKKLLGNNKELINRDDYLLTNYILMHAHAIQNCVNKSDNKNIFLYMKKLPKKYLDNNYNINDTCLNKFIYK